MLDSSDLQLVRADQTIWDQFNAPQGAQVFSCPFQLQLPPNLPPSFHYSHMNRKVAISYSLEIVGSRHGLFHANRRIRKIFSVVPAATGYELNANAALRQGPWGGPWKPISYSREIRHGIFGDHSQAKMEVSLVFPFCIHNNQLIPSSSSSFRTCLRFPWGQAFPSASPF